mmetsp:Transcript_113482/g.321121  ORF Transcript_113482/g.321121 Transcript_113482/m.321121 type:complete len:207 (-) Transcript_113482:551-1171(-)
MQRALALERDRRGGEDRADQLLCEYVNVLRIGANHYVVTADCNRTTEAIGVVDNSLVDEELLPAVGVSRPDAVGRPPKENHRPAAGMAADDCGGEASSAIVDCDGGTEEGLLADKGLARVELECELEAPSRIQRTARAAFVEFGVMGGRVADDEVATAERHYSGLHRGQGAGSHVAPSPAVALKDMHGASSGRGYERDALGDAIAV